MEISESWEKQGQQIIQQREQQPQAKQVKNLHQLVSQPMIEQIQDDLTQLRNKQNQTPLVFYGKVGNSFIFSYNQSELCSFMTRFLPVVVFFIICQIVVQVFATISKQIKITLICLCITQIIAFLLLFFLDPGTLFEDQSQKINEEKLYCQTCRIYKRPKTQHCKLCVKCVKGYDHHCGFFGKCIGRRNYFLFAFFICVSSLVCIGSMGSLIYTIFKPIILK